MWDGGALPATRFLRSHGSVAGIVDTYVNIDNYVKNDLRDRGNEAMIDLHGLMIPGPPMEGPI